MKAWDPETALVCGVVGLFMPMRLPSSEPNWVPCCCSGLDVARVEVVSLANGPVSVGSGYDDEEEAALAHDDYVRKHKLKRRRLHFPRKGEE